ncbi:unnamed protein product, partial [marine sediment metagenome]
NRINLVIGLHTYLTPMKRTGIFFTYFQGERLRDFPQVLAGILDKENVSYYDAV